MYTVLLGPDPTATERLGEWLGEHLQAGQVLALVGELGSGKTTLVRGLARGLRVDDPDAVSSPTYLLVVEHPGPVPLVHADAYLPQKLAGFLADGGLDYLHDRAAVVAVEWADRMRKALPNNALWISLAARDGPGRKVACSVEDPAAYPWLGEMPKMFGEA